MTRDEDDAELQAFSFVNLSPRGPSRFTALARRWHPGTREVAAQIEPYADRSREMNLEAVRRGGPMWVVFGDSLCQGIGATSFERGWVPQCSRMLAGDGVEHRVINLSFSGARIEDVIQRQIPALATLSAQPKVCTVMIGSNDLLRRELRTNLLRRFAEMLELIPDGSLVTTYPRAAGGLALVGDLVEAQPPGRRIGAVPLSLHAYPRGTDRWHPGDAGYQAVAERFHKLIAERLQR